MWLAVRAISWGLGIGMTNEPGDRPVGGDRLSSARRTLSYVLAVLIGPLVLLLTWSAYRQANLLPALSRTGLEAAERRWQAAGVTDYSLEVVVRGRQPATYSVVVRGGQVQTATRNGQPLTQPRTMDTWSVPGMFRTIATDLETVERAAAGDTAAARLLLRARFDPQLGYPARYHRVEAVRVGANPEVSWQVVRYTAIQAGSGG